MDLALIFVGPRHALFKHDLMPRVRVGGSPDRRMNSMLRPGKFRRRRSQDADCCVVTLFLEALEGPEGTGLGIINAV